MVVICGPSNIQNDVISYVLSHELQTNCSIVEETANADAIEHSEAAGTPDLVLIDGRGSRYESTLESLQKQSEDACSPPFLAIHNLKRRDKIRADTLRKGVRGLFYVEDSFELFVKGIRTILRGEIWVSKRTLLELTLDDSKYEMAQVLEETGLTHRELEVLAHLSRGETNEEIAELLCVSAHTVKSHLYSIYQKINVNNRFQASLWAAEHLH